MIALINSQKNIAPKAWVLGLKEVRTCADTNPSATSGGGEWTTEDLLFTQEFFEGFNYYGQEVRRKEPTHALIEGHVMEVNQAVLFLEKKGFSQDEAVEYLWSLRRVMLV